ncbi:sigma-54-dependent Fis family transcriptional regulator [Candidatus Desantisbacteria bacterium]|nr:sigma-54-dependent Fis family transcriptional regulator [Candidatus Desantisbacteria bacterium]
MNKNILLVDDQPNMLKVLSTVLKKDGNIVHCSDNPKKALTFLDSKTINLLITDLKMPEMDGLELLKIVREKYPDIVTIMITAHGTIETAVEAMKMGACDYLLKPFDMDEIKLRVNTALNTAEFKRHEIRITSNIKNENDFNKLIGDSKSMKEIVSLMKRVAVTDSSVLIIGETGTGKELIARGIHDFSTRKNEPFIAINCAAIPENLLESELFGHEKGAFTGAIEKRKGRFELASGGTLFLDEIADMSFSMQVKLLRVLQEKTFERIGGNEKILFTARVICATNKNLETFVNNGNFREDLYYRINVIPIEVPPLREHKEDIDMLINHFTIHFCKKFNRPIINFTPEVNEILLKYNWPGNIRELENTIERILVLADNNKIELKDVPEKIKNKYNNIKKILLKNFSQGREKEIIINYLKKFNNNRVHTANALGINRRTLSNKMKIYQID